MSDLIDRQASIDAIWNTEQHDVKSTATYNRRLKQLVKIINAVAELPSAELERKTGHWIITEGKFMHSRKYRCSECAHEFDWIYNPMFPPVFNFCQKCGARMSGC